jgi:hypothetical protein
MLRVIAPRKSFALLPSSNRLLVKEGRGSQMLLTVEDLEAQCRRKVEEERHSLCQYQKKSRRES